LVGVVFPLEAFNQIWLMSHLVTTS